MPRLRTATTAAALLLFAGLASTQASPQSAEQAYQKGDFAKSQQDYAAVAAKEPAKAELQFNTGSAAYKAGDYAQAASGFEKSLKTEQVPLQQEAYYNLGNTKYRLGQKTEKENPQETIKTWEEAVKSYDAALQIKASDADAKHNRDFVQREDRATEETGRAEEAGSAKTTGSEEPATEQSAAAKQGSEEQRPTESVAEPAKRFQGSERRRQESAPGFQGQEAETLANRKTRTKIQKATTKSRSLTSPKIRRVAEQGREGSAAERSARQARRRKTSQKIRKVILQSRRLATTRKINSRNKPMRSQARASNSRSRSIRRRRPAMRKQPMAKSPRMHRPELPLEERREANELTKEEAKQLLDALKNDERKAPVISEQGRGAQRPDDKKILKDW